MDEASAVMDGKDQALMEQRIERVLARIEQAAARADRDPASITVLLATKTRTPLEIATAVRLLRERGREVVVAENRAQEIAKHEDPALGGMEIPRHFIGRLQTNKAKDVIAFASVIHSVDRDDIAAALQRRAELADVHRDVMVQVNTSGEESKGGYEPTARAVTAALEHLAEGGRLRPVGLMTIGAHSSEESAVRASLARLARLRDEVAMPGVAELSMGMSADLEIAVEEGATIVRLGSAVFGARPAPPTAH